MTWTDHRKRDTPGHADGVSAEVVWPLELNAPPLDHHLEELLETFSELTPVDGDDSGQQEL